MQERKHSHFPLTHCAACRKKLEIRTIPASDDLVPVEFPLYRKYQILHHGEEPAQVHFPDPCKLANSPALGGGSLEESENKAGAHLLCAASSVTFQGASLLNCPLLLR